ncbi:MAG: hypothetical protein DRH12_15865 [Deltaproteobacteria bacterium]|nr:MAG: hypothetical protein DRH12_15865 [Deltaproteobacteria bacterium]
MDYAISSSKVSPPALTRILARPRLTKLIKRGREKTLTLILGRAAQGKSTVAATYTKALSTPAAWLNLDTQDSDPINLYYLLVRDLDHLVPEDSRSFLLSYPSITLGPRLQAPLLQDWAQTIFDCLPFRIDIIFDGLDRLDPEARSYGFLKTLVDNAPDHVHMILVSREEPPISISEKKLKDQVHVIDNSDLAFTAREIRAYFSQICGLPLSIRAAQKAHELSEGWIGGLVLLSQLLSRVQDKDREKYIDEGLPEYFKIEVFRYFAEEILSSQPEWLQDVYIKSAIFDVIEPALLTTLVPLGDTENLFHETAQKNLFTEVFYDKKRGWMFRYHTLYREFLLDRFRSKLTPTEQRILYSKVGRLYEKRDDRDNAIQYFLEAREYKRAASIMEKVGMDLLKTGRLADLSGWLESLPQDMVEANPWLLFYLCMARRFTETRENILRLERARRLFKKGNDISGQLLCLAFIIEASILAGRDITPMAQLLEQGELILSQVGSDQFIFERATLLYQMGFGYTLRSGDFKKGYWTSKNAYVLAQQLSILTLRLNALATSLLALTLSGKFFDADNVCADIEQLVSKCAYRELRFFCSINQVQLLIVKGNLEEAKSIVESAQAEAERLGLIYIYHALLLQDFQLRPALGEFEAAEDIGARLLDSVESMGNLFFTGLVNLFLGVSFNRKKDFIKAEEYIGSAIHILSSPQAHSPNHLCVANLLLGLVHRHLGKFEKARWLLEQALKFGEAMPCYIVTTAAYMRLALVEHDQHLAKQATSVLAAGFKLAQKYQAEHIIWMSSDDFMAACLLAIDLNIPQVRDYAAHLLASRFPKEAKSELLRLSHHPKAPVRKLALEIRKKIKRTTLPVIRILTLGEFQVIRGCEMMVDRDWLRAQSQNLLKAIISHGSQNIPKDLLAEALWPKMSSQTSANNFKVTLHRLRKSLGPAIDKTFGSAYIHVRKNRVSLDPELCQVDVDQFESLIKQARSHHQRGQLRKAIKIYTQASDLYQGDYMPQDLSTDWIQRKRNDLKTRHIETLLTLGRLYESLGTVTKAIWWYCKAIEADPLLEEAYQRLMVLYSRQGKTNLAIRTYEKCRQELQDQIQTQPEPATKALFEKIAQNSPKIHQAKVIH